jgi:hypothetical protein
MTGIELIEKARYQRFTLKWDNEHFTVTLHTDRFGEVRGKPSENLDEAFRNADRKWSEYAQND